MSQLSGEQVSLSEDRKAIYRSISSSFDLTSSVGGWTGLVQSRKLTMDQPDPSLSCSSSSSVDSVFNQSPLKSTRKMSQRHKSMSSLFGSIGRLVGRRSGRKNRTMAESELELRHVGQPGLSEHNSQGGQVNSGFNEDSELDAGIFYTRSSANLNPNLSDLVR